MSAPLLSVVVPVRNSAEFIHLTLNSLEELDKRLPLEVIFQDANSTDGTSDLIRARCVNHPNWLHFVEKDEGQSDAINRGFERSKGRWLAWICADDALFPDLAEALLEADKTDADILYGDLVFATIYGLIPAAGTEQWRPGALAGRRLIIQQPGTSWRREIWFKMNGLQKQLFWFMDYDLFLRMETANARFRRVPLYLGTLAVHDAAKSSSGSIRRLLEVFSILWAAHRRTPRYFRLRPYLVYGIEYVIKALDATRLVRRFPILPKPLHALFWAVARPLEKNEIEERWKTQGPAVTQWFQTFSRRT